MCKKKKSGWAQIFRGGCPEIRSATNLKTRAGVLWTQREKENKGRTLVKENRSMQILVAASQWGEEKGKIEQITTAEHWLIVRSDRGKKVGGAVGRRQGTLDGGVHPLP